MATREEMALIRDARNGQVAAQLGLGKRYLFGSNGLKKNLVTALYWLHRAATQGEHEAWILIGSHIPYEIAAGTIDPAQVAAWYERAFEAGVVQAGLVWARLLLMAPENCVDQSVPHKALLALEASANAGNSQAQWLLAKALKQNALSSVATKTGMASTTTPSALNDSVNGDALAWAIRAASGGWSQAQAALAERAWSERDLAAYLHWALPAAREILNRASASRTPLSLGASETRILSRCGRALIENRRFDKEEVERLLTLAAQGSDKDAQFALGLWLANLDETGSRCSKRGGRSNYASAAHWLRLAAEQGIGNAWYLLHRIGKRSNILMSWNGSRNLRHYLERAAESGVAMAQLELGTSAWHSRHGSKEEEVRAVYWLQHAASQGNDRATLLLQRIAHRASPSPSSWAWRARQVLTFDIATAYPLLALRIELAAVFGLSVPEALLLDVHDADRRHCLLIDIRKYHARSKRRLILIDSAEQRATLDRVASKFAGVDCGSAGPEGNYRKRLYLINKLFPFLQAEHGTRAGKLPLLPIPGFA